MSNLHIKIQLCRQRTKTQLACLLFYFFSVTSDLVESLWYEYTYLVYVAHDHPLNCLMPQYLPRCRALTTSHDEHGLWAEAIPGHQQRISMLLINY